MHRIPCFRWSIECFITYSLLIEVKPVKKLTKGHILIKWMCVWVNLSWGIEKIQCLHNCVCLSPRASHVGYNLDNIVIPNVIMLIRWHIEQPQNKRNDQYKCFSVKILFFSAYINTNWKRKKAWTAEHLICNDNAILQNSNGLTCLVLTYFQDVTERVTRRGNSWRGDVRVLTVFR